jgi:hypothetical protein
MAIITTPARLNFGSFAPRQAQTFNTVSFNLTAANGGLAFPFIAEHTMTVTDIGAVMTGIGVNVAGVLTIGIQSDSGAGLPSGTFLTNGSITLPAGTWTTAAQFTATSGSALLTRTQDHYLKVGDTIRFANTVGGTTINTDYWIKTVPAANQMTLSTDSALVSTFTFSASVTAGANTINYTQMGWTHCAGITAAITQGTPYWLVYQWSTASTGNVFFAAGDTGGASGQSVQYGIGYATRTTSTWNKIATTRGIPIMYTDGTSWFGTPQLGNSGVVSSNLNNNDRFGFRFTIPAGHPDILLDRITFAAHPTSSPGVASTWKAQLFTDAATPTLITDLSSIPGDTLGNSSGAGNFASTVFQTSTTTWLTAGTSYLVMCGFDVTPASGNPTVNYFSRQVLATTGRTAVVGAYRGDFILNWPGSSTWYAANPEAYAPWSITTAALRYNNSGGGGGGGFANGSCGFSCLGGN